MSRKNLVFLSTALIVFAFAIGLLRAQTTFSRSPFAKQPLPPDQTNVITPENNVSTFSEPDWFIGPQPDQFVLRDRALAKETNQLLTAYRAEKDSAKRNELAEKLKQKLTEHFDVKQKIRETRLAELEERVKRLREDHDRRTAAKSRIVEKRFDHLIDQAEGLGWNATTELPKRVRRGGSLPSVPTASR